MRLRSLAAVPLTLLCAGIAAILGGRVFGPGALDQQLSSALGTQRPFEARLSGFAYATCCSETPSDETLHEVTRLAPAIRRALESGRTDALRATALLDLLLGSDVAAIDRAITRLRESLSSDHNADVLNDLAVAYAVRAERAETPADLLRALDYAERALNVDSAAAAPRFNRAFLLERLSLAGEARAAWSDYIALDARSGWGAEATRRLAARSRDDEAERVRHRLSSWFAMSETPGAGERQDLVRAWPQLVREGVFESLLDQWAASDLRGDTLAAAGALQLAGQLGESLIDVNGDASVRDAVRAITCAASVHDVAVTCAPASAPRARRAADLANGHRAYAIGLRKFRGGSFHKAVAELKRAARLLESAGSPFHWWPRYYLAAVGVYLNEHDAASTAFEEIRQAASASRYPSLAALAHWGLGLDLGRRGSFEPAVHHYRAASELFAGLHEHELHGGAAFLLAEILFLLGEEQAAFEHASIALGDLLAFRASVSLHNVLAVLGRELATRDLPHAALAVHAEGLRVADRTGRPNDAVEARVSLARALSRLGRLTDAGALLDDARTALATVTDSLMLERLTVEVQETEASVLLATHSDRSLRLVSHVVDYFERAQNPSRFLPALALRSAAHRQAGDDGAAEHDLRRALDILNAQAAHIRNPTLRLSLFDSGVPVFDGMIRLQLDQRRPDRALEYLELSRGGAHAERDGARTVDQLMRALPPEMAVVDYALLGDSLLVWALTHDTMAFALTVIPAAQLDALVERFENLARLRIDSLALGTTAQRLYEILLSPVAPVIAGREELVILADRSLHRVPFAALRDPTTGRFVIEDHVVRSAPSIAALLDAVARERSATEEAAVLIVSGPEHDRRAFPDLPPLRAAAREADAIAALYGGATVLHGASATRAAFLSSLGRHEIVHYAGHARFAVDRPERSHLVLTPPAADSGGSLLYAADLSGLELSRVRLVILSACSTFGGSDSRLGGFAGFAQAFLHAGAGAVLGNLWDAEDERTAELLVEFHKALAAGASAPHALAGAQRLLLRTEGAVGIWFWGGWRLHG